jgi:hypothetical protein
MNIEKAYEYDILNRKVTYTLEKTVLWDLTQWQLKDDGVKVMRAKSMESIYALRKIRDFILNWEAQAVYLCLTTDQKWDLGSVTPGFKMMNSTTGTVEWWNGSEWV